MPLLTQGKTNWKYILIVVVLAVITTGAIFIYQKDMIQEMTLLLKFHEIKKPEEGINAQQVILSNEEVSEILGIPGKRLEYSEGPFYHPWTEEKHKIAIDVHNLLVDAFQFKNEEIKKRLEKVKKEVIKWGEVLEDAPDSRAYFGVYIKLCITESIIYNDLKNTIQYCGYKKDFSFNKENVDDLTADSQVLPFFINGYARYYEGNHSEADYYFNKVKLHHQLLKTLEYVDLNSEYFERYNKIYNKILKISPEREEVEIDWEKSPFPPEITANLNFQKYIERCLRINPELELDKFIKIKIESISGYITNFPPPNEEEFIRWVFSPDKTRAVAIETFWSQPDQSLIIYNRNNDGRVEQIRFCGTACAYLDIIWLNNKQFVFIWDAEYHPPGEQRCVIGAKCTFVLYISLYDLTENTELIYQSQELEERCH